MVDQQSKSIFMFKILFLILLLWAATFLWPAFFQKLTYGLVNRLCGLRRKEISDGKILWPYLEKNPDGDETILLVHGIRVSKDTWSPYINTLHRSNHRLGKKNFRYISVDLPGFGEHPRDPSVQIDTDTVVEYLLSFMDALNLDKVHLIGNSMGSLIASKFAIKYSDRLHSLTIINGAGTLTDVETETEKLIQSSDNPFELNTIENFDRLSRLSVYKPMYLPRFLKQALINDYVQHREYYDEHMTEMVDYIYSQPLNPDLHRIQVPTLVIWGLHDKIFDVSCCGHLEQSIPNCKVVILHNSAHVPFVEQPKKTATYNIKFLQSVSATNANKLEA